MKKLREKLKKQDGFTLVEMLIVVAIIAILVAVSIPLVAGALEKSRDATDHANERAAKACAALRYLEVEEGATPIEDKKVFAYDAENGKLVDEAGASAIEVVYGKCTAASSETCYDETHEDKIIWVQIDKNADVQIKWSGKDSKPTFD